MKTKIRKSRNYLAVDAWFRNSAGAMRDDGDKYECRKFKHKNIDWKNYDMYNEDSYREFVKAELAEEEDHRIWWEEYRRNQQEVTSEWQRVSWWNGQIYFRKRR